jgi:hypothetical protein
VDDKPTEEYISQKLSSFGLCWNSFQSKFFYDEPLETYRVNVTIEVLSDYSHLWKSPLFLEFLQESQNEFEILITGLGSPRVLAIEGAEEETSNES